MGGVELTTFQVEMTSKVDLIKVDKIRRLSMTFRRVISP